jgi:predicted transcriptional regulator
MTTPAVTIHPDASIAAAARLMSTQHMKRLPVVDPDGKLLGLVSRRDLLNVFCIPDTEIARQVREVLTEALPEESDSIKVAVHGGIVTLTGKTGAPARHNGLTRAIVISWDLDGVVDIINHVKSPQPA